MSPALSVRLPVFVAGCLMAAATPAAVPAHVSFRLANGLTVIVHEDHAVPAVSIDLGFRVGAADDSPGKPGLAHLAEHLMFTGSTHYPAPYLPALLNLGASDTNATTGPDGTHFFETVPRTALDRALWLESDRMGYLSGALSQADLDSQRGAVRGEMRTHDAGPFPQVDAHMLRHLYPANHPYRQGVLGTPSALDAVTLDDAKHWFASYYGAANATLVLAGDITPAEARTKAEQYFGEIAPGPTVPHPRPWAPVLSRSTRAVIHGAGSGRRIVRTWVLPGRGHADLAALELAASLLAGQAESRLQRRLVVDEGVAVSVSAVLEQQTLASEFTVKVDVAAGRTLAESERSLDRELASFITSVASVDELALIRGDHALASAHGMDSVATIASDLADGHVQEGDPAAAWRFRERIQALGVGEVGAAVRRWLAQPHHTAVVVSPGSAEGAAPGDVPEAGGRPAEPSPGATMHFTDGLTSAFHGADRVAPPALGAAPPLSLPAVQRGRLANGTQVVLMAREGSALTRIRFLFGGGYAADHGRPEGTANLAMSLLARGTAQLPAADFHRDIRRLGASLNTGCEPDACYLGLEAPAGALDEGLTLATAALREPAFAPHDFELLRKRWLSIAGFLEEDAGTASQRLMLAHVYGDHPYASDGDGTLASLAAMQRSDLEHFHRDAIRPDNLDAVVVVGDIALADVVARLDKVLAGWMPPKGPVPLATARSRPRAVAPAVYLIDRPDAPQAVLTFGTLVPGNQDAETTARELASMTWGKAVDDELRERRGWSYGATSEIGNRLGWRAWTFHAGIDTPHAAEALSFIVQAMQAQAHGVDGALFDRERQGLSAALPALLATGRSLMLNLSSTVLLKRPDDHLATLPEQIAAGSTDDVARVTAAALAGDHRVWVVAGDRRQIEPSLRALLAGPLGPVLGELHVVPGEPTTP